MVRSRVLLQQTRPTEQLLLVLLLLVITNLVQSFSEDTNNSLSTQQCQCSSSVPSQAVPWNFYTQSAVFNPRNRTSEDAPIFRIAIVWIENDPFSIQQALLLIDYLMKATLNDPSFTWNFRFQYSFYSGNTTDKLTQIALEVVNSGKYHAVVGPSRPDKTTTFENMFASFAMPQIAHYSTDPKLTSSVSGYSNFLAVCPSESDFVVGHIQTILSYGWKKVVFLSTGDSTGLSVSLKFADLANQNGIRVMESILLQDSSPESFRSALRKIQSGPTRLIVTLFDDTYLTLFSEAESLNMLTNEYIWLHSSYAAEGLLTYTAIVKNVSSKLGNWLDGSLAISGALKIGTFGSKFIQGIVDWYNSIQNFFVYQESMVVAPASYYADAMLTFYYAANAMVKKGIPFNQSVALVKELRSVSFVGVTGLVEYSPSGGRLHASFKLSNFKQTTPKTIAVLNPKPTFQAQTTFRNGSTLMLLDSLPPNQENISKGLIVALYLFAAINIIVYIINLMFITKYRLTTLIQQSGYSYLCMILLGSILMVSSVFVLGTDLQFVSLETRDKLCMLSVWQIGIGYILLFGSLFAKSLRILLIVSRPDLKNSKNVDKMILIFLFVCSAVEIVLLILWTSIDRLKATPKYKDDDRTLYFWCASESYGFPVSWIAYNMFFLFCGVVIAFQTKNVERRFNESKIIGFSIYNVFILCVIIIPLTFAIKDSPDITFIFQCIGVIGVPLGSTVMLFGKYIYVVVYNMKSSSPSTKQSISTTNTSS